MKEAGAFTQPKKEKAVPWSFESVFVGQKNTLVTGFYLSNMSKIA